MTFVVKCAQNANMCANIARDDSQNHTIWWSMSVLTKAPKLPSHAKCAANISNARTISASTGKYTWQLVNWIYHYAKSTHLKSPMHINIPMNFVDKRMWCDIDIWHMCSHRERVCMQWYIDCFMSTQPFVFNFMISHNLSIGKPLKTSWYRLCVRGMCLSACASYTKTENAVLETSILCLSGTQNLL